METQTITFIKTTDDEYQKIKQEISKRYKFVSVKRNKQQYALGGFDLIPRDHEHGLTSKQIDALCTFLGCLKYDDSGLYLQNEEVYGPEHKDFAGTKKRHFILRQGFYFLMKHQ